MITVITIWSFKKNISKIKLVRIQKMSANFTDTRTYLAQQEHPIRDSITSLSVLMAFS